MLGGQGAAFPYENPELAPDCCSKPSREPSGTQAGSLLALVGAVALELASEILFCVSVCASSGGHGAGDVFTAFGE